MGTESFVNKTSEEMQQSEEIYTHIIFFHKKCPFVAMIYYFVHSF